MVRVRASSEVSTTIRIIGTIGTIRVVPVHIWLVPSKGTRYMARLLAMLGVLRVLWVLWMLGMSGMAWNSLLLVMRVVRVRIPRLPILAVWSHGR